MEPERKIEKLLRAWAKKRRADAGDAFKLHPATRRLLQGEIARHAPKRKGDTPSLWRGLRQRWAVSLALAIVLCLGTFLILPVLHNNSGGGGKDFAAMPVDALTPLAAADKSNLPATIAATPSGRATGQTSTGQTIGPQLAQSAGSKKPAEMAENSATDGAGMLADNSAGRWEVQPGGANGTALAFAENAPRSKSSELPGRVAMLAPAIPPAPLAAAPTATVSAAAPAAPNSASGDRANSEGISATRSIEHAKMSSSQNATQFKSELAATLLPSSLKNSQRFVQTATKRRPPVLASFELQQNGSQISVVDRDGSVYNGSLQPMESTVLANSALDAAAAEKRIFKQPQTKDLGTPTSQSAVQNYSFRVSGANRSLKQNVEFAGNLIAISNLATNAFQNFGGGKAKSGNGNAGPQQAFSNSRIAGTVTIDRTNQIEINALPVNP